MLRQIYSRLQDLLRQEDGQDLAEYSLILLLVVSGTISAFGLFGTQLDALYTSLTQTLFP
jgi:Flp pilus assembly pilin Flp